MSKKILTLNVGTSGLTLAEYAEDGKGALTLVAYGSATFELPLEAENAATTIPPALLGIVREKGIRPGKVALAVPGQMVFQRFATIPAAGGADKLEQMVRFEMEQNIPFPMDEMICDHQVLGETAAGDTSVMIAAAKTDQIEAIAAAVASTGFAPVLIDTEPFALMNVVKATAAEPSDCVLLLDIGARTTSFLISEGEKLYTRSIPLAGQALTKEIANALGCSQEEAEAYKRENGYVAAGGVVEDPDATRDRVSKVCRAVLTRLAAEISRSVNFYRSQQGGSAPTRLYLAGAGSLLPQLDGFFSESLGIEVEYLNPFNIVAAAPALDMAALESDAILLAPTAGIALHREKKAVLQIDLMPPSLIAARAEAARIPFVAAGSVALVMALVAGLLTVQRTNAALGTRLEEVSREADALGAMEKKIKKAQSAEEEARKDAGDLCALIARRGAAVERFNAVRQALGDDLWIDKWEDGPKATRVTIRGWKDHTDKFVARYAARNGGQKRTTPEIVVAQIKASPAVDPASVKVADMTVLGKGDVLEQFVVEMMFK
ncbi:MAG TPA: hypothetical protein DD637_04975 [Verrucomicrobia bacterium]|nr:hypothetical protein [Verrucomicrobiota bacterium]HCG20729.1 hypothetical protein [Verrucomicrobiota bacterium]